MYMYAYYVSCICISLSLSLYIYIYIIVLLEIEARPLESAANPHAQAPSARGAASGPWSPSDAEGAGSLRALPPDKRSGKCS